MNSKKILEKLNNVFRDELDNKDIFLNLETTAKDIEEWDSLSHIQLISAVEKYFDISFTSIEIQRFKNVGDLCLLIEKKLKI